MFLDGWKVEIPPLEQFQVELEQLLLGWHLEDPHLLAGQAVEHLVGLSWEWLDIDDWSLNIAIIH